MKRAGWQVITSALKLIKQDIWDYRGVWISLGIYFAVIWRFFKTSCTLVVTTGYPCPACGLTRAAFSVIRGDFVRAFEIHAFIYPLIALGLVAMIRRYLLQKRNDMLTRWLWIIVVGIVIYYCYRMWRYFPGEPPISYYHNNWLKFFLSLVFS